jgi:hypothetical protein
VRVYQGVVTVFRIPFTRESRLYVALYFVSHDGFGTFDFAILEAIILHTNLSLQS